MLATIAAVVTPRSARADDGKLKTRVEITLRGNLTVDGDTVNLGDLFEIADERGLIALVRSPAPGHRAALNARQLQAIALRHNLLWYNTERLEEVTVQRASHMITMSEIKPEIVKALQDRDGTADLAVQVSNRNLVVHLPVGLPATIDVLTINQSPLSDQFDALVEIAGGTKYRQRIQVFGRAVPMIQLPVLARNIQKDDIISEADIIFVEAPAGRLAANIITDPADLIGKAARRSIGAQTQIRTSDVQEPILVKKGSTVTMIFEVPGMTLTDLGRALQPGGLGDIISVTNPRSNITIRGMVIAPNQVTVDTKQLKVAAN